ncbi:MAG: hypothetical protein R8G34_08400 [Paracoccaceae bacterium]|nr:hypothetical protein [Paracoccaceae bacterium]
MLHILVKRWAMSDYKPHPDDTEENTLEKATEAIVRARPTNRYYIFPMADRTEIAFGNGRHLTGRDGKESFQLQYHTSISLDDFTVRDLHRSLTTLLEVIDKNDG